MNAQPDPYARIVSALAFVAARDGLPEDDARLAQRLHDHLQRKVCVTVVGPAGADLDAVVELLLGTRVPELADMPNDVVLSYGATPAAQVLDANGETIDASDPGARTDRAVYGDLRLEHSALQLVSVVRSYVPPKPDSVPMAAQWIAGFTDFTIFAAPEWTEAAEDFTAHFSTHHMDHALYLSLGDDSAAQPPEGAFMATLPLNVEGASAARFAETVDFPAFKASGAARLVAHLRQSIDRARQNAADQAAMLLNRLARNGLYDETAVEPEPVTAPLKALDFPLPPSITPKPTPVAPVDDAAPLDPEPAPVSTAAEAPDAAQCLAEPVDILPSQPNGDPELQVAALRAATAHLIEAGQQMKRLLDKGNDAKLIEISYAAAADVVEELRSVRSKIENSAAILQTASDVEEMLVGFAMGGDKNAVADCISALLQLKRRLQMEIAQLQGAEPATDAPCQDDTQEPECIL